MNGKINIFLLQKKIIIYIFLYVSVIHLIDKKPWVIADVENDIGIYILKKEGFHLKAFKSKGGCDNRVFDLFTQEKENLVEEGIFLNILAEPSPESFHLGISIEF